MLGGRSPSTVYQSGAHEGAGELVNQREQEIADRVEAATPLTDEEYATWKGNIEIIAKVKAGPWYRREGDGFVLAEDKPSGEVTTTVGIQLRLFATIDALREELGR